jgi:hypothetical protein
MRILWHFKGPTPYKSKLHGASKPILPEHDLPCMGQSRQEQHGCPLQAIVAAYQLDERTVMD